MPFRLTRNLQRVLGPLHLKGTFTAAMSSAAQCLRKQEEFLKSYLSLFIRDDLVSWYTGKVRNKGTGATVQDANAERLKSVLPHLIRENVAMVTDKVCGVPVSFSAFSIIEIARGGLVSSLEVGSCRLHPTLTNTPVYGCRCEHWFPRWKSVPSSNVPQELPEALQIFPH